MLIDTRQLRDGEILDTGVCIVGAGAAGITLARELDAARVEVCLLEAGGLAPDAASTARYAGSLESNLNVDTDYLTSSRLRYFGGTTNHWEGWCRPLDAIDFETRAWIPHSGWPFPKRELDSWYRRAVSHVAVDPFDAAGESGDPLPGPGGSFRAAPFHMSPPVRFGPRHREALAASERVRVLLHANVTSLRSDAEGARVTGASVSGAAGSTLTVRARHYVLAAGAIENARLLLVSRDASPAGLGNAHDRVGRFFMDHPHRKLGDVAVTAPEHWLAPFRRNRPEGAGCEVVQALKLDESVQRTRQLPNVDLLLRDSMARIDSELRTAGEGFARFDRWGEEGRRAPTFISLRVRSEPFPNPESRVTLADEQDDLGVPRVRLVWRMDERDAAVLDAVGLAFAEELGRAARGRVRLAPPGEDAMAGIGYGSHHVGTTRMHDDPKLGVVDRDGRVHGVPNLSVAGSSVFPTAGASNPTLTIVALCLRLAARLSQEMPK